MFHKKIHIAQKNDNDNYLEKTNCLKEQGHFVEFSKNQLGIISKKNVSFIFILFVCTSAPITSLFVYRVKKNPSHIILTSLLPQREMTDQMTMSNVRVKNSHRSDSASVFPLVFLSTFTLYTIVEKFKTVYVFLWLLAWCG